MPLIMALCVIAGILIGTFYANHFSGNRLNIINSGSNRLSNLLHIINDQYVDKVDIDSLVDIAIPQILADLDPHSVYISAKDAQAVADDLKGSFSGVGIEFTIRQDTIRVQNVVKNGPAQRAGIIAGDKIVSVDGKPFVGKIVRERMPRDCSTVMGYPSFAAASRQNRVYRTSLSSTRPSISKRTPRMGRCVPHSG